MTARTGAGKLAGVAPFYRSRRTLAPGFSATRLRLLGTGPHRFLTELPQILTSNDPKRRILRDILRFVVDRADNWDWVEVTLAPDQGWFEPQWLPQDGPSRNPRAIHSAARACVVLPLESSWSELQGSLKRNVKESIRRGANRLARAGHSWEVVTPDTLADLESSLDLLVDLHRQRSMLQGKPHHPDYFADPLDRAFLRDVAPSLFSSGHLSLNLLCVNGIPAAGRLVLRANQTCFFSASGLDPAWWDYSLGTTLMTHCLKSEMARGATSANLSLGPDRTKLRWSETLETHNEFMVVARNRRSRLAFRLYQQRQAIRVVP